MTKFQLLITYDYETCIVDAGNTIEEAREKYDEQIKHCLCYGEDYNPPDIYQVDLIEVHSFIRPKDIEREIWEKSHEINDERIVDVDYRNDKGELTSEFVKFWEDGYNRTHIAIWYEVGPNYYGDKFWTWVSVDNVEDLPYHNKETVDTPIDIEDWEKIEKNYNSRT